MGGGGWASSGRGLERKEGIRAPGREKAQGGLEQGPRFPSCVWAQRMGWCFSDMGIAPAVAFPLTFREKGGWKVRRQRQGRVPVATLALESPV